MTDGTAQAGNTLFGRLAQRAMPRNVGACFCCSSSAVHAVVAGKRLRRHRKPRSLHGEPRIPSSAAPTKAYFLEKYGEPDKRIAVDATTDIWEYTFGEESLSDYACARQSLRP